MTTAQVGYLPVNRWVKHVLGSTHTTVVVTVAWAVLCLLVAQRATSAALARALNASTCRSRGGALVTRDWSSSRAAAATCSTARSKAG